MISKFTLSSLVVVLCVLVVLLIPFSPLKREYDKNLEFIKSRDRILILAPHPDDETIGCAGIIQQALSVGAKVKVAYLTNGDHNEFAFIVYEKRLTFRQGEFIYMGEVRRSEAIAAMKLLGLKEDDLVFMGYPDFGTLNIFNQYWQADKPFKSILTRISKVPYENDSSYGTPYVGESILGDLENVLLDFRPNKIFVSHPHDTNCDHKALYLFLQIALRDLRKELPNRKVYPYLIHCAGWPSPRHYHPDLALQPPKKFADSQIRWQEYKLSREQVDKKYRAILCYKSQTASAAFYLLSFARRNELFGDYPQVAIRKQATAGERGVSFFGFSDMYPDSDMGPENLIQDQGQVSYAVVDNHFLIHIKKTRKLNIKFNFRFYLFGYSSKKPFSTMPKITIVSWHKKFVVFNKREHIEPEGVSLDLNKKALTLSVPLSVLGDPEFILAGVAGSMDSCPSNFSGFRRIAIK